MTFLSYAQNFEDVLLWRALREVGPGFYIDVGAWHPDHDSVTRAFYDRGWHGINIEPVPEDCRRIAAARPRDVTRQLALGETSGTAWFNVIAGTGLSGLDLGQGGGPQAQRITVQVETLAAICREHAPDDIHFLKIDVEGAERAVLAGADFRRHRPWIVLLEATAPGTTEPTHAAWEPLLLQADYMFVWFDGLNRFYVAAERHGQLAPHFRVPPNVFDDFLRISDGTLIWRLAQAEARAADLGARADAAERRLAEDTIARAQVQFQNAQLRHRHADELALHDRHASAMAARAQQAEAWVAAMHRSTSWRLTRPLRRIAALSGRAAPAIIDPPPEEPAAPIARPPPQRVARATRVVHQFHSGSAAGDAITQSMLLIRRMLRALGYRSDLFVEHQDPELGDGWHSIDELPAHGEYVLILHHSMGYDAFDRITALPAAKVLIYHNITPEEFLPRGSPLPHYARLGRRQLGQLATHVVASLADSDYNLLELLRLGFDAPATCMLLFDLAALRARADRHHVPARTTFTILFVGRITSSKAQRELAAAYRIFRTLYDQPSRLVLVGRDDGGADAPWPDHVTVTGLVSEDELHRWYARADLYVSLSRHEGFGVPLVEAMAHGVPVLAWPAGAVAFTLDPESERLADASPAAVASAMAALAADPDRRTQIAAAQRAGLARFDLAAGQRRLVQALVQAGAMAPADPALQHTLTETMHFAIAGHVNKTYSLAAINRNLALAIEAERPGRVRLLPVEGAPTADLSEVPAQLLPRIADLVDRAAPPTGPEITISQHYPIHLPASRGDGRLALVFWEESLLPRDTIETLNAGFDGVLAPSNFVAKALRDSGLVLPLHVVGIAPDLAAFRRLGMEQRVPGHRRLTFLHVSSGFPRKGIDVLLRAYAAAFRRADPVHLVIKTFPNRHNHVAAALADLQARDAEAPGIELIDRDLEESALVALYRDADVMVLPTRGEGFNLPAAEALAAGLRLIVTGFGGHMDFCNAANSRLIDYRFAPSDSHLAIAGSVWVEPDEADLTAALREAAATDHDRAPRDPLPSAAQMVTRLTEAAVATILAAPPRPYRIAWISTWNVRCGIAEYSRLLLEAMPQTTGITILADDRTPPDNTGTFHVVPAWQLGAPTSVDALSTAIFAADPDIVVVQHQPGLFGWGALAALLSAPAVSGRVVIVTLHSTRRLHDAEPAEREWLVTRLMTVSRIIVHTDADLNLLKGLGLVDNVALFAQGAPPPASPQVAGHAAVIGCYGFFVPGKGIPHLIDALAILRRTLPDARLRLVNAEYDDPSSAAEIAFCRAKAAASNLTDAIEWRTDFQPHDRSIEALAGCDVIVLPYQGSRESSSAALRTALASGACVAVTPITLFDEAEDAIARLPGNDAAAIAQGIVALLQDPAHRAHLQKSATHWLHARSWPTIATRFQGLMLGLLESKESK